MEAIVKREGCSFDEARVIHMNEKLIVMGVDPGTGLPFLGEEDRPSGALYAGPLQKKGGVRTNWLPRWFVLWPEQLDYYDNEGGQCRGIIPLDAATEVWPSTAPRAYPAELEVVASQRTYRIKAETKAEISISREKLRAAVLALGGDPTVVMAAAALAMVEEVEEGMPQETAVGSPPPALEQAASEALCGRLTWQWMWSDVGLLPFTGRVNPLRWSAEGTAATVGSELRRRVETDRAVELRPVVSAISRLGLLDLDKIQKFHSPQAAADWLKQRQ